MTSKEFNAELQRLCDALWSGDARLQAANLYIAGFTGFGTERAYELLNALRGLRADEGTLVALGIYDRVIALLIELETNLNEPPLGLA